MIRNKFFLMCGLGFLGAAVGALLAEALPDMQHNYVGVVVEVSLWAAVVGTGMTIGLFTAVDLYHRKQPFRSETLRRAAGAGSVCGAISGAAAQTVYFFRVHDPLLQEIVFRPACWGIMGGLLGYSLSKAIPNLGAKRGAVGGLIGGFLGGIGFVAACTYAPQLLGQMAGVGVLGAALGFAIVTVEVVFRKASLEVIWAANEKGTVSLGSQIVYVGSGPGDQIYALGARAKEAGFVVENDHVQHLDGTTGKKTIMGDGSRLRVGKLEVVVRLGASAN